MQFTHRLLQPRLSVPPPLPIVLLSAGLLLAWEIPSRTASTERLLLSGRGRGDTVQWQFRCDAGPGCGSWTTIPVPSQWELEGLGHYNYGHDRSQAHDVGHYRYVFTPPLRWRGWTVDLVFEGVMTDAEVRLNGLPVGVHRGGFYRFRFPVEDLLVPGAENQLEVTVREHSAEPTINRAEREADYWIFGGIYRPVLLEARPPEAIHGMAINARHDGELSLSVHLVGLGSPATVHAEIRDRLGQRLGTELSLPVTPDDEKTGARRQTEALLSATIPGVRPWSAEDPYLYRLHLSLLRNGRLLHEETELFGFRTIERRPGQGLFINGHRTLLKGVNRHAFWPDSGRTLSREIDRRDVELIRGMNMNAVRTAHYPPDRSFLDACDELGLYVLDELAGWHEAYSTPAGRGLAREMVERDRNHPSILFWVNGNEGGWNKQLDAEIRRHDPQLRPVLHPRSQRSGVLAPHYPTWARLRELLFPATWTGRLRAVLYPPPLILPTESLHGLHDGGSGAGLDELWSLLRESPRALGLFLWELFDEAVVRGDRGGRLDTQGDAAPDGILGPYRETTANADAIRAIWSPVVLESAGWGAGFDRRLVLANRFDMTDLAACTFSYRWIALPSPAVDGAQWRSLQSGEVAGPAVPPGERGELTIPKAPPSAADALELTARGPDGRLLQRWVLERRRQEERVRTWMKALPFGRPAPLTVAAQGGTVSLQTAGGGLEFDLQRGSLRLGGPGQESLELSLTTPPGKAAEIRHFRDGASYVVVVDSADLGRRLEWRLDPGTGWVRLAYDLDRPASDDTLGLSFDLSAEVLAMEWLGGGPGRVWGNRLAGPTLGLWRKTRAPPSPPEGSAIEPVLPGYYRDVNWARLRTDRGTLAIVLESDDVLLRILRPTFPEDALHVRAPIPPGTLSLEARAPAIGTKFHTPSELAPKTSDEPRSLRGAVWLRYEISSPRASVPVATLRRR